MISLIPSALSGAEMSLSDINSSGVEMGSFEDWQWLTLDAGASSDPAPAQPTTQWPTSEPDSLAPAPSAPVLSAPVPSAPVHSAPVPRAPVPVQQVHAIDSTESVIHPVHQNVHPGYHGYRQPQHPHQGLWPHPYPTMQVGGAVYRVPSQGWYQHQGFPHSVQHMPGSVNMPPRPLGRPWGGLGLPQQGQPCPAPGAPSNRPVPRQSSVNVSGNANAVAKPALNGVKKLKRKRKRTAFTTDQILALEKVFVTQPYIERKDRQVLGQKLNIDDRALKVWFQNRRMKGKRLKAELEEELEEAMNSESPDSDYNSGESIISSSNDLEYVESQIKKTDGNGLVTLDNRALETLFNVIEAHVPAVAEFTLTISKETAAIKEDKPESPKSTDQAQELPKEELVVANYEPISSVESLPMEQDGSANNTERLFEYQEMVLKAPTDEDKKMLFKLHFC